MFGATLMERLGYRFQNPGLLQAALTHPSAQTGGGDNQRLEYLGDAVLQLCVSRRLFDLLPKSQEGELSRRRAALVREESLAEAARRFGVGDALLMGHGEAMTGGREKPSVLSDAMEAILAAVYLDGGLDAAQGVVDRVVPDYLRREGVPQDYKTQLQERLQAAGEDTPTYSLVSRQGPDHAPTFQSQVESGGRVLAQGTGSSKKSAEQQAARAAIVGLDAKTEGE